MYYFMSLIMVLTLPLLCYNIVWYMYVAFYLGGNGLITKLYV